MNHQKLIEISYALLDWAEHEPRTFHVSFLTRRNKILAIGINKNRTHTINLRNKKHNKSGRDISDAKFQCSEYRAFKLSRAQNVDYSKCRIYNVRINRENEIANAEPCESCRNLLSFLRLSDCYATNSAGSFEKVNLN